MAERRNLHAAGLTGLFAAMIGFFSAATLVTIGSLEVGRHDVAPLDRITGAWDRANFSMPPSVDDIVVYASAAGTLSAFLIFSVMLYGLADALSRRTNREFVPAEAPAVSE